MSLGLILVIILVIFLLGGFSGRFGGYGYCFYNLANASAFREKFGQANASEGRTVAGGR